MPEDIEIEGYAVRFVAIWSSFIDLAWVLMTVCAVLSAALPSLSFVGVHGKRTTVSPPDGSFLQDMTVPKRFFAHFYILGSFAAFLLLGWLSARPYPVKMLAALLFLMHCLRRLWECLYLTDYGTSVMHLAGYLVGMLHYLLVPATLLTVACEEKISHTSHTLILGLRRRDQQTAIVILVLYLASSLLQFHSHRLLYHLKRKLSKADEPYPLPAGGGFDYCSCPHYLAEIGIYTALLIAGHRCRTAYLMWAWVVTNLSIVAYQQYSWYLERYPEEVAERNWAVLFPFLW